MRVLFWCQAFWPEIGGISVIASSLVRSLESRGHELHVLTDRHPEPAVSWDSAHRGPIARFPLLEALSSGDPSRILTLARSISELKSRWRPEVVLVFTLGPSVILHLQTKGTSSPPTIVTVHGSLPFGARGHQTLVGRALQEAEWVMTCSRSCLQEILALYPAIGRKSSVVLNAIERTSAHQTALDFEPPRLLYVGRLSREKGVDVAILALRAIAGRCPGAVLQLAGDGPLRGELKSLAVDCGLEDRIEFLGFVPPDVVPELMARSSIVVVPSRSEGFSLVALEAAHMGRPIVATRVGGIPEVVVDNHTGILVPAEDPIALAMAILRLITDPQTAEIMGSNARRRADSSFLWTDYVNAYDDRINELGRG